MGIEIERKYIVINDNWKEHVLSSKKMSQGYLSNQNNNSVRVRIANDKAHLNIKSGGLSIKRLEYEYEIPLQDAEELLTNLTDGGVVEKTRYKVKCGDHTWDLDIFEGVNDGLQMAEVELDAEDEQFQMPDWAGKEVSDDARYYNVNLISNPYRNWKDEA